MRGENIILVSNRGRASAEPRHEPTALSAAHAKGHATLAAQFALAGLELISEVGIDSQTRLYTIYCGKVQQLDDPDYARAFLSGKKAAA